MGTDVAAFAKQLKEDGIDAAKKEAENILAEARKEAKKLLDNAKSEIEKMEKDAENRIAQKRANSEAEVQLAARDLMNSFRKRIEEVGTGLLKGKIAENLNDKEVVKNAISELLKTQKSGQEWELAMGEKLGKSLADTVTALFKAEDATVKLTEELKKAGFELKAAKGNEVIEVTEDSISESFKKLLSPELKKILEV